ncbi:MAG: ATP-binding protein [Anaerovoracaceae bacterium]
MMKNHQKTDTAILGKVVIWGLFLCLVIAMFLAFTYQNRNEIQSQNDSYVKDNAEKTAVRLDAILLDACEDMESMAFYFSQTMESPVVTPQDLQQLTAHSQFDYIRFTDAEGNNLAADGRTNDARDREYYLEGMQGRSGISVTLHSRITNETLVNFYTPLRYQGEIIGVLRGVFLAEKRMKDLLDVSFFDEPAEVWLCMEDGTFIAGSAGSEDKIKNVRTFLTENPGVSEAERKNLLRAFETGEGWHFHYPDGKAEENGYICKIDSQDWFLVQTFPTKITDAMYASAIRAGMILEISLIALFVAYILVLIAVNRRQKKRLLEENRDMGYVIHGIPQLYDRFVLLNPEANSYRCLMDRKEESEALPEEGRYDELTDYIVRSVKEARMRDEIIRFLDPENIREKLDEETRDIWIEYQDTGEDGEWYQLHIVCVEWKADSPAVLLLAKQNVTDAKKEELQRQEVLQTAIEAAEASSRAKSTFLFNMSHDIRTPMNAIIGFAGLAEKQIGDADKVRSCIEKIQGSSEVLLKIINDILDLARIESGKAVLMPAPANLKKGAEGIRDMFAESMRNAGIFFQSDVEAACPYVYCDILRMNQIAINLVNNAQKFTPAGGSVLFRMEQVSPVQDGKADYRMIVRDSGIGMKPEFLERIFEPFERERTSTVSGIQGTGLGLSIVKNLVDMMGGTITIQSEPDTGTEVVICLRLSVTSEEAAKQGLEKKTERIDFGKKRILLVEDNALNRELARELLEEEDVLVEEAENGAVAVERIQSSCPGYYDLVLMDIQMPVMDGYEAVKIIRGLGDPGLAAVPIVAMTANAFEEDRQKCLQAGMNGHLGKPINMKMLNQVLSEILC